MNTKLARLKMQRAQERPGFSLPKNWTQTVESAVLHAISLARFSLMQVQGELDFLVTAETIASWMKRIRDDGSPGLVQIQEPVSKFPEFVRCLVQRVKVLCPTMGKVKIAEHLARAGLHLARTTVRRILKEKPQPKPAAASRIGGSTNQL